MTSRERMLTALENGRPDRLPGQVHSWMRYYLQNFLGGCDQFEAYERFGLDMAIYSGPSWIYSDRDLANWQESDTFLGTDETGASSKRCVVTTPGGELTYTVGWNDITSWHTEPIIKTPADFELWDRYYPVPVGVDCTQLRRDRDRLGDRGIVRGISWCYGQPGPWQSFCFMVGTQEAILFAIDDPEWVHHVLERYTQKTVRCIEMMGEAKAPLDLVEIGGGAGSNTVISPAMHREFCLPYDRRQVDALHAAGYKVVYHLCGGLMQMLDLVVENGSDGLETMTPPSMGADCDLAEANRRVGDRLFFVGGFDQNQGFENGTPESVREQVFRLHTCCPDGGYICSPSDHFFTGDPANIQAFADALKECVY